MMTPKPATTDDQALNVAFLYTMMIALGGVALAAALVYIRGESSFYLWMLIIIEVALVLGAGVYVQHQRRQAKSR